MHGQAGLLQADLEQQRGRVRGDLDRPWQQQQRRHSHDDAQVPPHAGPGGHQGESGGKGNDPDQWHERGGDRDGQAGGPGRPARPPGRQGQHPPGQQGDRRYQHEDDGGADPAGGDRAHGDGQQRIRGRGPDPDRRGTGDPPHGEECRDARQRHAAEQDHVNGQPRLAAEHGRDRGDHGEVRRRAASGADADRVEALQVLVPEPGRAAPRGNERAAAKRPRAEQRPLGDQGYHRQGDEQQHTGAGQDALHQPGVGQQVIGFVGIVGCVMRARRVHLGGLGQRRRGELSDPPQRPARRQLAAQPPVGRAPAPRPAAAQRQQPERVAEHRGHRAQLVHGRGQALGKQEEHRAQQRYRQVARCRCEHRQRREVPDQGQHRVAAVEPARAARDRYRPPAAGGCLHVIDDGIGDQPDPVARLMHPPAEVDVLAEQSHVGVEAAHRVPDVAADQHAGAADREAVAVPVVLALVDFARLDAGDPPSRGVDGHPGLEDHLVVGPVPDLGTEHSGRPGLDRPAEQLLQGVVRWLGVVVQQPHPLDVPGCRRSCGTGNVHVRRAVLQRARDGGAVARGPVHAEHDRLAEQSGELRAAAVPAAGVDGDHALHRPALVEQRADDAGQPRGAVVRDDHRRDDVLRIRIVRRQVGSAHSSEGHLQAGGRAVRPVMQGSGTP